MDRERRELLRLLIVGGTGIGLLETVGCADDSASDAGGIDSGAGTDSGGTDTGGADSSGPMDSGSIDSGGPLDSSRDPVGDSSPPGDAGLCATTSVDISMNHLHALAVPQSDILAGVDRIYDIMGASVHNHTVTLTAADFATLRGGGPVTVTTSLPMPVHDVTVRCV